MIMRPDYEPRVGVRSLFYNYQEERQPEWGCR